MADHSVTLNGIEMTCRDMAELGTTGQLGRATCTEAQAIAATQCFCSQSFVDDDAFLLDDTVPTPFPSFVTPCHVCGEPPASMLRPNREIILQNEVGTCQELLDDGARGLIPPQKCLEAKLLAQATCGCSSSNASSAHRIPTYAPTTTPLPTFAERCFVCGGRDDHTILADAQVTLGGVVVSCRDLSRDGEQGYIPPELCAEAQSVAAAYCHCHPVPTTAPTLTFTPTKTLYPTFAESCRICPFGQSVTKLDHLLEVDGGVGTCRNLEKEGANGFVAPSICPDAQATAQRECGCAPAPSPSETLFPTYDSTCYICGNSEHSVTAMDTELVIGGERGTCQELQRIALSRLLPERHCLEAQAEAAAKCQCKPNAAAVSTPTMEPTLTMYPTYGSQCHVCPPGSRIQNPHLAVTMDGIELTCAELEQAGHEHVIPPNFCSEAQTIVQKACKCSPVSDNVAPSPAATTTFSPTVTPLPTMTFTPTFTAECKVCPGDDSFITIQHALVEIDGLLVSCIELDEAARQRMVSPSLCPTVQAKVAQVCGCRHSAHITDVVSSNDVPTAAPAWTFQPTITAEPTLTVSPTYAARCDVCGSPDQSIAHPNTIVHVAGIILTCKDLKSAGESSLIPPQHCSESRQVAHTSCGCGRPPLGGGAMLRTFVPTITPAPTVTPEPTYAGQCELCPNGERIEDGRGHASLVILEGYVVTCAELEDYARQKHLSFMLCLEAQQQAQEICGCASSQRSSSGRSYRWGTFIHGVLMLLLPVVVYCNLLL